MIICRTSPLSQPLPRKDHRVVVLSLMSMEIVHMELVEQPSYHEYIDSLGESGIRQSGITLGQRSLKFQNPGFGISVLKKIKFEHISLTSFSEMRVELAAQVSA